MTAGNLPESLVGWLVKLCGMLGSAHDGERAAAGVRPISCCAKTGCAGPDVIGAPQEDHDSSFSVRRWREPDAIDQRAAARCLRFPEALTEWEIKFCPKCRQAARPPDAQAA